MTITGTRPATQAVRDFLSRTLQRTAEPSVPVTRRQIPYWQERGWVRTGNTYDGSYRTPFGSFLGQVRVRSASEIEFFLYQPSEEIRQHSHFICFQEWGNGWYFVHMGRRPDDVSSGILTIERLITEAYED